MHAFVALTLAHLNDILRRPSTLVLAGAGTALILSLRWFSAFGLGYEVVQLLELGVYTVGLLGAVAAALFWLPREDEPDQSEGLLLTRPVSPWVLSAGAFGGRLLAVAALSVLWTAGIAAALLWFKLEDPVLFSYRGADSVAVEMATAAGPILGQLLATAVLLALVQPLARTRAPAIVAVSVLVLYVLGYSTGGLGLVANVMPDLSRQDTTASLWGTPGAGVSFSQVLHACAWCAIGIALDSGVLRLRSVS
jgi:hypothetical protein